MRAAILATLLLAGCATPAAVDDSPAPALLAPLEFGVLKTSLRCDGGCFEPSVAVDPEGRIFAADGGTPALVVSLDGGATWEARSAPPIPDRLEGLVGDVLVQVTPDGALYYSTLIVRATGIGFILEGIQVAWSDDAAETWAGNTILSPVDSPGAPILSPDRQWLGFAEDGAIYLSYNQIPSGIWIARSDDRGATWGGWTRAAAFEQRGAGIGQSGPPVVDAEGRVYVPACSITPAALAVFVSEDGGATFARHDIGGPCSWFPILVTTPKGGLVAAWTDDGTMLRLSASDDAAATWSDPVEWSGDSVTSPWPLARADGTVDVLWLGGDDAVAFHVSRGDPRAEPLEDAVVVEDLPSGGATHFAHGARLPDGRLVATWTDGESILAALQLTS